MKPYLFSEIVAATGGAYHGDPALLSQAARDIVIDSKKAVAGSLFVPIIGEKHDAHQFIPNARENGASLVVTDTSTDVSAAKSEPATSTDQTPPATWVV